MSFRFVETVGTTSVFPYISEPVLAACHLRKPSIEINPGETTVTKLVTVKVSQRAAPALDAIWSAYNG
jgi:NAD-dependent deacetylase